MQYIRYIPLFLFTLLCGKLLINGSQWTDAPIFLGLGLAASFFEYKTSEKKLAEMEATIAKQNDAMLAMAKALDEVRTSVSSMRLAQGMKTTNVGRS